MPQSIITANRLTDCVVVRLDRMSPGKATNRPRGERGDIGAMTLLCRAENRVANPLHALLSASPVLDTNIVGLVVDRTVL